MYPLEARATRIRRSHPLRFWRYDDARVWAWIDTSDEVEARRRIGDDLTRRGWNLVDVLHTTMVPDERGSLGIRSAAHERARRNGSYFHFRRWFEPPRPKNDRPPLPGAERAPFVVTSRLVDIPEIVIDETKLPANLRELIPLARFWAIGDDVERAEALRRASASERRQLVDKVMPLLEEIECFCDARRDLIPVPDEVLLLDMLTESAAEAAIND